MKLTCTCIPSVTDQGLSSEISLHFGRSPYLTFLKFENNEINDIVVIKSSGRHVGGRMTPPEIILKAGTNVLLCGNLGPKAINMLQNNGIKVFVGALGTVEDAIEAWKEGKLNLADENSHCHDHR